MKYINEQGIVIEALQWDGTEESRRELQDKLCLFGVIEKNDYHFRGLFGNPARLPKHIFEITFKPISDARALIVEELKKEMLLKLAERQKTKNDNWRDEDIIDLKKKLQEECAELDYEVIQIVIESDVADFDAARKECADVANYAAIIHDKLNAMELEAISESKEKA
jgi:hypothetical protein